MKNLNSRHSKPKSSMFNHATLTEETLAIFRTKICEQHRSGSCVHADRCRHSHCQTWQRRNPVEFNYSAKLCPEIEFTKCNSKMTLVRRCNRGRGCCYAHSKEEELYHPTVYKTKACSSYPYCNRYYCPFAHGTAELRKQPSNKFIASTSTILQHENSKLETKKALMTSKMSEDKHYANATIHDNSTQCFYHHGHRKDENKNIKSDSYKDKLFGTKMNETFSSNNLEMSDIYVSNLKTNKTTHCGGKKTSWHCLEKKSAINLENLNQSDENQSAIYKSKQSLKKCNTNNFLEKPNHTIVEKVRSRSDISKKKLVSLKFPESPMSSSTRASSIPSPVLASLSPTKNNHPESESKDLINNIADQKTYTDAVAALVKLLVSDTINSKSNLNVLMPSAKQNQSSSNDGLTKISDQSNILSQNFRNDNNSQINYVSTKSNVTNSNQCFLTNNIDNNNRITTNIKINDNNNTKNVNSHELLLQNNLKNSDNMLRDYDSLSSSLLFQEDFNLDVDNYKNNSEIDTHNSIFQYLHYLKNCDLNSSNDLNHVACHNNNNKINRIDQCCNQLNSPYQDSKVNYLIGNDYYMNKNEYQSNFTANMNMNIYLDDKKKNNVLSNVANKPILSYEQSDHSQYSNFLQHNFESDIIPKNSVNQFKSECSKNQSNYISDTNTTNHSLLDNETLIKSMEMLYNPEKIENYVNLNNFNASIHQRNPNNSDSRKQYKNHIAELPNNIMTDTRNISKKNNVLKTFKSLYKMPDDGQALNNDSYLALETLLRDMPKTLPNFDKLPNINDINGLTHKVSSTKSEFSDSMSRNMELLISSMQSQINDFTLQKGICDASEVKAETYTNNFSWPVAANNAAKYLLEQTYKTLDMNDFLPTTSPNSICSQSLTDFTNTDNFRYSFSDCQKVLSDSTSMHEQNNNNNTSSNQISETYPNLDLLNYSNKLPDKLEYNYSFYSNKHSAENCENKSDIDFDSLSTISNNLQSFFTKEQYENLNRINDCRSCLSSSESACR